ncbi:MAG TPA: DNA polymerase III subunit delta' [Firmicutes bacterium]|nr:DNA polymerase III subunit delta' [Bacillota bacterium]
MFENLIGQERVKKLLKKIIETEKIPHAFLFYGKDGVGKRNFAIEFSKIINGLNESLLKDITIIEEEKSIGIDKIRELKRTSYLSPQGKFRINIINNAHLLTIEAANSLLKILEEPPERTIFILITPFPEKLPDTVISRCLPVHFSPIPTKSIEEKIKERVENQEEVKLISRISNGSLRKAYEAMDKDKLTQRKEIISYFISFLKGNRTYIEFVRYMEKVEDFKEAIISFEEVVSDMVSIKRVKEESLIKNLDFLQDIFDLSISLSMDALIMLGEKLFEIEKDLKYNLNQSFLIRKLGIEILKLSGGINA